MPLYYYKCNNCTKVKEEFRSISNRNNKNSCDCGGELQRDTYGSIDTNIFYGVNYGIEGETICVSTENEPIAGYTNKGREDYAKVSNSNKQEYEIEKRSRELLRRGYNIDAVSAMMKADKSYIKKLERTKSRLVLDGRL